MPISEDRFNALRTETKPKVDNKPSSPTPAKEPTKLSNWDEKVAPILDQIPEAKKAINYENSKHIMRAVNGRYDNAMSQLKTDDPKAYETFKNFKNSAWNVAKELEKLKTGGFDAKALEKYQLDANAYYENIRDSYGAEKKKAWVMDDEARFVSFKQDEKNTQTPYVSTSKQSNTSRVNYKDKGSSNISVEGAQNLKNESPFFKGDREIEADYENPNVAKAYNKLKSTDEQWRNNGLKKIQPITKSWTAVALANIGGKTTDADTNGDALSLITTQLYHINKHKTTQDPDLATKDQQNALKILKQIKGKTNEQKFEILKNNASTIKGMTSRMGYFGNAKVYNQFKKSHIGTNLDFYPTSNVGKTPMDYFNETRENGNIDMHIYNYRQFREGNTKIKQDAKSLALSKWQSSKDRLGYSDYTEKDVAKIYNSLVDENGTIKGYSTFLKDLGYDEKTGYLGKTDYDSKNDKFVGSAFTRLYNKSTSWDTPVNAVQSVNNGQTFLDKNGRVRQSMDTYVGDKETFNNVMKKVYSDFKKNYKRTFDDQKIKNVYNTTLLDLNLGDEVNQSMEFRGVDLRVNKDMKLKASTGPKQENVNKVFNLMFDDNGNIDTEKVTIFGNKAVKEGLYAIDKTDLEQQKKYGNEAALKDFLKDNNEHVTMSFFRNTNVPGQAAYQFYNPDTKKSIMVYTPKELIGKNGVQEDLYSKTGRSPLDVTFKLKGELEMPIIKNDKGRSAYKSAVLKYDRENNTYYGETVYNGVEKTEIFRYTIPNANQISIDQAQRDYLKFLYNNKNKF
jgi:hypothetical protein